MAFLIRNRKTIFIKLILIFLLIICILGYLIYSSSSSRQSLNKSEDKKKSLNLPDYDEYRIDWKNHPRGVITTLTRSSHQSIIRLINMIHSVVYFHSTKDEFHYPFIIFHDQSFNLSICQYILSCVNNKKTNQTLDISFILIDFPLTNITRLPKRFSRQKDLGYHYMCRFWSYDVFYHPLIVKMNYDYLMRMDIDSYFLDQTPFDLFQYMIDEKLDYIYRSWYSDDNPALFTIEKFFSNRTSARTNCIYNNFFLLRLQWFYRSSKIQRFLHELIREDLMLREYIADGCVHAAILDLDQNVRTKHLKQLPYGHNYHIMLSNNDGAFYNYIEQFYPQMSQSCHQLIIIQTNQTQLKTIQM